MFTGIPQSYSRAQFLRRPSQKCIATVSIVVLTFPVFVNECENEIRSNEIEATMVSSWLQRGDLIYSVYLVTLGHARIRTALAVSRERRGLGTDFAEMCEEDTWSMASAGYRVIRLMCGS